MKPFLDRRYNNRINKLTRSAQGAAASCRRFVVGASLATERASAEMAHLQGAVWSEAQDQTGTVCKPANLQVCSVRQTRAGRPLR
ncbi:hypothetical protein, partial [Geminisphaera colitermitum]|uniref:hypothetical protein n=1 Tax=Geminisphaera colitermitum TaxID=1148786 RepID=UPI001E471767